MVTFTKEDRGQIASVTELLQSIDEAKGDQKLWFRGHAKSSWSLVPTIGRDQCYGGKRCTLRPDDEWMLLHRFRRRCYAAMDRAVSPLEAMFLARHTGAQAWRVWLHRVASRGQVMGQQFGLAFDEIGTSQRRNTEVRLTHRWRKPDSNHRSRVTPPSFRRRLMSLA